MPSFAVRIDTPSLEISASGAIWGGVWVEIDGRPFPETRWNDMSVAFIAAFLDVVRSLSVAGSREVRFMDGPFGLSVRDEGEGKLSIMATEVGGNGPSTRADKTTLLANLQGVAETLLAACTNRGWSTNPDVRHLASLTRLN